MNGEKVEIPEGYCGLVISEFQKPLSETGDRTLTVQKKFGTINYWNWDQSTNNQDPIQQSMDWLSLSKLVIEKAQFKFLFLLILLKFRFTKIMNRNIFAMKFIFPIGSSV